MILNLENKIIDNIKKIGKIPYFIARHIFLFFIIVIIFELIFVGWLYYKYVITPSSDALILNTTVVKFEKKAYQDMISYWGQRKIKFDESFPANILNPFKEKIELIVKPLKPLK